jgi:hypothetical protein
LAKKTDPFFLRTWLYTRWVGTRWVGKKNRSVLKTDRFISNPSRI